MTDSAQCDFLIVGSGGGAVTAALAARDLGQRPLIVEKQARFGGSTAYSGGVLWIPNNRFLAERDSVAKAMTYLDRLVGDSSPASTHVKRLAFVTQGPRMLDFLERHGMQFMHAYWPDYYSDAPGGLAEGRSLVAPMFDINALGDWGPRLARFEGWPDIPIGSQEFATISLVKRTWRGRMLGLRVAARLAARKITGRHLRASGNAVQGRLLQIALRERIPIRLSCAAVELIVKNNRVVGAVVEEGGRRTAITASNGVLINAGGFSRNPQMRAVYQPKPLQPEWSLANPGDTGEMIQQAMSLGAAVDLMNEAWWCPSSMNPDGSFGSFHIPTDTAKPHLIIVDQAGQRLGNEANSYMEFGQRMFARGSVPSWAVFDSRHRAHYSWGMASAGSLPVEWLQSGYLKSARTVPALAQLCGIDPLGLQHSIERFNGFADAGVDQDFQRGASAYNRYNGDPRHYPNPNLGRVEQPPFYACALYPVDVGTAGGLLTDQDARVLTRDGVPIDGLYATGNSAASVMGRFYPGAGASIGSSFTFGYIAALHANRKS